MVIDCNCRSCYFYFICWHPIRYVRACLCSIFSLKWNTGLSSERYKLTCPSLLCAWLKHIWLYTDPSLISYKGYCVLPASMVCNDRLFRYMRLVFLEPKCWGSMRSLYLMLVAVLQCCELKWSTEYSVGYGYQLWEAQQCWQLI